MYVQEGRIGAMYKPGLKPAWKALGQPDLLRSPVIIIIKSTLRAVRALVKECFISPTRPRDPGPPFRPPSGYGEPTGKPPWPPLGHSLLRLHPSTNALHPFHSARPYPSTASGTLKPAEGYLLLRRGYRRSRIHRQESISCSWRLRDEKTRKRESFRSWLIFVSKFLNRDEGSMRRSVTRRNIKVISKRVNSCDANKRMQLTMAVAGKHVYFIDVIFTGWPTTCLLSKTHNAASIRSLGKLP